MNKKDRVLVGAVCLALAVSLLGTGCTREPAEPVSDVGEPEDAAAWPAWIPPIIPPYGYGKVFHAMDHNGGGSLIFGGVDLAQDPYGSYKQELLDAGWVVDEETETEEARFLGAKREGYWLRYSFPRDGQGVQIYFGKD